jgi:UDP-N-acetylmuramate dehydrogenase
LSIFLQKNTLPVLFLGLGSNLLLSDKGFPGVVIKLTQLNQINYSQNILFAQAGVTLNKLSRFCIANQLLGTEFLAAIPGTLGGALKMNAGAFGFETWTLIQSVQTINLSGKCFTRNVQDFNIGYRQILAKYPDEYFIGSTLTFKKVKPKNNIQKLLEKRKQSQPIGLPTCGSVFKNPPHLFAAQLIEEAGLKGFCMNKVCVSDKHANFIINNQHASADNIIALIKHIQIIVKDKTGVSLETEVILL